MTGLWPLAALIGMCLIGIGWLVWLARNMGADQSALAAAEAAVRRAEAVNVAMSNTINEVNHATAAIPDADAARTFLRSRHPAAKR